MNKININDLLKKIAKIKFIIFQKKLIEYILYKI